MSQLSAVTSEGCAVLLRINLLDCFASSTKVRVESRMTANDICELLSNKLGLSETDAMFYCMVCVAKCIDKKSMHWVRTLQANDHVLEVQADMEDKAVGRCPSAEIAKTVTSCFYYKDIRSNPLDLDGDASGNSSSDDESEIPLNDLMYFGSGERRGFLHRRSSRDPNVWRRRLCILNDKLWCINVKKNVPWASCVKLNHSAVLEDRNDLKYTNTISLRGNDGQSLFFRTNAPLEKHRWREEIRERTLYGADNEVIMMAEMIITDEEEMGEIQMQKSFMEVLQTPQVWKLVSNILDMTGDEGSEVDIYRQNNFDDEELSDTNVSIRSDGRQRSTTMEASTVSRKKSAKLKKSRSSLSPPRHNARPLKHREESRRRSYSYRSERDNYSSDLNYAELKISRSISNSSLSHPPRENFHLSRKIGRWPHQIFHILHQKNPACAAGMSLICAAQHYKGGFRHDFYLQPKDLWGNALHVYIHYILPYMDFMKMNDVNDLIETAVSPVESIRQESQDELEHRKNAVLCLDGDSEERSSMALTPSQYISMETITHLHRALFSNIRKKRKKTIAENEDSSKSNASSPISTSWFWSSSEKTSSSDAKSKAKVKSNEHDIYNTDYEILDNTIKPNIAMYDEFVQAIYKKFEDES